LFFSVTQVFASGDTVRSKKKLKRKTRLVVDAEKHEISPHLADIMDRATDGAEEFEKY
jgi:hypothetical protein